MPFSTPGRILVVDDQPSNIQVAGSALGKLGHEIIPASDGPTALKRLALRPPDLVLLDLLMPGMDGCEVCQKIRANPNWNDIPVIFLSAADDKDFILRAFDAGGVDYITKPFNHAELVSRVRTHLALKIARDRLKQLAEDRDELNGILAHDLKNHLGGMEMSARLLSERLSSAADTGAAKLAENILHSGSQLLAFVKEFLANAAADHGVQVQPSLQNLAQAAGAAAHQYREAAHRKNQEIETDISDQDAAVLADRSALRQVLDNLLSNALKFSPAGSKVKVSVRSVPGFVECEIQDQGPGFTPEDQVRMFQRYGRLSARPTGGEPSSGLGLSIVRKLVEAMSGELVCRNAPGAGAAFIVRLQKLPAA
jgi:two-component system sensor histidine kinase/response regulator